MSNYDTTYSCTGGISGTGTAVTLSPSVGVSITCTFTNSLKLPLLSIIKSANASAVNPGQTITYTVQITNTGSGNGSAVVLSDNLSPYSAFGLNTYGINAPFSFNNAASGLSLGTPQYSSDNGSSWSYSPVSGGGGAPAGYDGIITNWRIPMNGSIVPGGSFTLNYRVIVK
jgi:uncharacterized repeat protein (TIGR01451 family)